LVLLIPLCLPLFDRIFRYHLKCWGSSDNRDGSTQNAEEYDQISFMDEGTAVAGDTHEVENAETNEYNNAVDKTLEEDDGDGSGSGEWESEEDSSDDEEVESSNEQRSTEEDESLSSDDSENIIT
jgi:hypothetical protein